MRPKYKPTDTPPWINRAPAGINRELTLGVESKRGRWWCATSCVQQPSVVLVAEIVGDQEEHEEDKVVNKVVNKVSKDIKKDTGVERNRGWFAQPSVLVSDEFHISNIRKIKS